MGITTDAEFIGTCSKCGGEVHIVIQYKGIGADEHVSTITVEPHTCTITVKGRVQIVKPKHKIVVER